MPKKNAGFKLKVYTILQFNLIVLSIGSQQEDDHPAISRVFQQQLARTASLREREQT